MTTAMLLSRTRKYRVIIAAKHMPGDYDISYSSPWAGANYMPVSIRGTDAAQYDRDTWLPLADLARHHPEAGVHFQECQIFNRAADAQSATAAWFSELLSPSPWFKDVVPDVRPHVRLFDFSLLLMVSSSKCSPRVILQQALTRQHLSRPSASTRPSISRGYYHSVFPMG